MSLLGWWQDKQIDVRPRFPWIRRRKLKAETALKLAIIPNTPTPGPSIYIDCEQADPTNWLLVQPHPTTIPPMVLNLEPVDERIEIPYSRSLGNPVASSVGTVTNITDPSEKGPGLAERLRLLLTLPLGICCRAQPPCYIGRENSSPFSAKEFRRYSIVTKYF